MFLSFKKAQSTPTAMVVRIIAVILLSLAVLLIIYFAISGRLEEILVSKYT